MSGRNDFLRSKIIWSKSFYIAAAAALLLNGSIAPAQNFSPSPGEVNIIPDELGINLTTRTPVFPGIRISIGGGAVGGLSYILKPSIMPYNNMLDVRSNLDFFVSDTNILGLLPITIGDSATLYHTNDSSPVKADGSSLSLTSSYPDYLNFTHTSGNGTISSSNYVTNCARTDGRPIYNGVSREMWRLGSSVIKPNNEILKYNYIILYNSGGCEIAHRLQSIKSNFGYRIHFDYKSNDNKSSDWRIISAVTAFNGSIDFCDDIAITCSFTQNWPKILVNNSAGGIVATENDGTVTSFLREAPYYDLSIKRNGTEIIIYRLNTPILGAVGSVSRSGENWTYSFSSSAPHPITRTSPLGGVKTVVLADYYSDVSTYTDENGRVTRYLYDSNFSVLQYIVSPEGTLDANGNPVAGYTKYDYDARGNIVQTTIVPKQGSGLANIVTSAGFDATCSNRKTCNQPNWTRDAKANQTDFTYASAHGGLLTEMRAAPSAGAARPLKVNTYAQRSAWIKNSSGTLVQSPDPVWLIATSTECQTVAGSNSPVCDASAPQTVTTYQYGASGTAEAMLVKGVAVASGGTTLRTCYGYDIFHRRISETKPNANLAVCP